MTRNRPWQSAPRWFRAAVLAGLTFWLPAHAANLVIATVDNGHMLELQRLSKRFEAANPDVRIRWLTLKEPELRRFVGSDIATKAGQVDVMTIGMYEAPIWASKGWLKPVRPTPAYGVADLLDNVRAGLSYDGKLYAAPIYGESSMLMYRKDLVRKAGLTMPARPTWAAIASFAARLNDPRRGVHGICLRASPGWGENMTLVTTMVNTYGGQWFDMQWKPQLESPAWKEAVTLYVDLLKRYGPKDAVSRGYNENLALFQAGKCAMWVDATVAAAFLTDPAQSRWAHEVGFAQAPSAVTRKGSHWLWAWALAISSTVDPVREAAAQRFINWATSRDYVTLVAAERGWRLVPSGTRTSTYANPAFQRAAPWHPIELEAIRAANPDDATLHTSPYRGVQFPLIPGFRAIGDTVGGYIADAVAGRLSVDEALAKSQFSTRRLMDLPRPMASDVELDCPRGAQTPSCRRN